MNNYAIGNNFKSDVSFISRRNIIDGQSISKYTVNLYRYDREFNFSFNSLNGLALMRSFQIPNCLTSNDFSYLHEHLQQLPVDHNELFHRNYSIKDSGNIIDNVGMVSEVLDRLRAEIKLDSLGFCFDKISLKRNDDTSLTGFHIDYFDQNTGLFSRDHGQMVRYFVNLGETERYVCLAWISPDILKNYFPNSFDENSTALFFKEYAKLDVLIVPIPARTGEKLSAVTMNVFDILHTSYGFAGDLCAIMTGWIPN